ncbi:MAG: DUF1232 domain-containing protein [Peptostreptococcaceae bacterium]|nr:DUF1232 domain-containing protein [Peptostreptococcaceae bacterium]
MDNIKEKIRKINKQVKMLAGAISHPDMPWYAKAMIGFTIAYALSPIDLIPDFIPVLGYVDDLLLIPLFIFISLKLIPKSIVLTEEDIDLKGKWYYGIPIVILWIVIIYCLYSKFLK